jgi:DNA-binding protein HU-beta
MNKSELVQVLAEKTAKTKVETVKFLDAFMEAISEALAKGEKIPLIGFGTFSVTERAARKARNPQKDKRDEFIDVPAKKIAKFKAGRNLDEAVNKE